MQAQMIVDIVSQSRYIVNSTLTSLRILGDWLVHNELERDRA